MDNSFAPNSPQLQQIAVQQIVPQGIRCTVSKRVSVQGKPILFMVRDNPLEQTDSGWTFLSGEELEDDESYLESDANFQVAELNAVANFDTAIVPLLTSPIGSAFERENRRTPWQRVTDIPPDAPVVDPYLYVPPSQ